MPFSDRKSETGPDFGAHSDLTKLIMRDIRVIVPPIGATNGIDDLRPNAMCIRPVDPQIQAQSWINPRVCDPVDRFYAINK